MLLVTTAHESSSEFMSFLIGWMSNNHHKEMAEAAERFLEIRNPQKLAEFKSNNIKEEDDKDSTKVQEN